jgi:23S rRNA (guanosine2251-2'-O)-methyltransferase
MRERGRIPTTGASGSRARYPARTARPDRSRRPSGQHIGSAAGERESPVVLYGWHTVSAALCNPVRRVRRLWATENAVRRLAEAGISLSVAPELVRPDDLAARLPPDAVHQGLLAEADPLPAGAVEDLDSGIVLALDQITDPHNVGAIVRTAAAFGVTAIVTTARHSPEATGVLAKSASGGLEAVPLVTVTNLARGLETLRASGFLLVGLAGEAPVDFAAAELRTPLALVLGAEGKGLRQLTRTTCDLVARLTLPGAVQSLNVSNAAAVALYIATTRLDIATTRLGAP